MEAGATVPEALLDSECGDAARVARGDPASGVAVRARRQHLELIEEPLERCLIALQLDEGALEAVADRSPESIPHGHAIDRRSEADLLDNAGDRDRAASYVPRLGRDASEDGHSAPVRAADRDHS